MSDAARPYVLLNGATLSAIERCAQDATREWANDWTAKCDALVRATPLEGPLLDCVFTARHGPRGSIWIRHDHQDLVATGTAVLGPELLPQGQCADAWVERAIRRAQAARNRSIAIAMTGSSSEPEDGDELVHLPAILGAPGSGAVQLSCEPLGWLAIIDGTASVSFAPARPVANAPPSVSQIGSALSAVKLDVVVSLGEVVLDLGKLVTLEPGDVLRLPKRLGDPVAVLCEGKPLARAALGKRAGRRSVQILSPDS